jgi:hypothetical protein
MRDPRNRPLRGVFVLGILSVAVVALLVSGVLAALIALVAGAALATGALFVAALLRSTRDDDVDRDLKRLRRIDLPPPPPKV